MKIPVKAQPLVNSICNAYRLKGETIAMKRFNHLTKEFAYYEQIMLLGYIQNQLGFIKNKI